MYTPTMTFQQWLDGVTQKANQLKDVLDACAEFQQKWDAMTYGLSDDQILALPAFQTATYPGVSIAATAADIEKIKYAIGVFHDLYNALHNVGALAQADRMGYLTPFI